VLLCCQGGPKVQEQDGMMVPVKLTAQEEAVYESIKYWQVSQSVVYPQYCPY
jgi:hypothetical protein